MKNQATNLTGPHCRDIIRDIMEISVATATDHVAITPVEEHTVAMEGLNSDLVSVFTLSTFKSALGIARGSNFSTP